jgi:hypothetical protein
VCTKAVFVTARAECPRQFGSESSSKYIDGTVHNIIAECPNSRAQTHLNVKWDFPYGAKHKRVFLSNIRTANPSCVSPLTDGAAVQADQTFSDGQEATLGKASTLAHSCPPPDPSILLTPTAVDHGRELFEEEGSNPIRGPVIRRPWSVRRPQGDIITESTDFSSLSVRMFPYQVAVCPLRRYCSPTNIHLLPPLA